jgi:uncharacterized LabA/DUF88 family protein
MNRVIFLIDGFNLYHSTLDIRNRNHGLLVKWLDIHSLCASFLYTIDTKATIEKVYYFSAYAYHMKDTDVTKRHAAYIECLKSTGVEPILGRFKEKTVNCPLCNRDFVKHEEKETDVAIAIKLLEVLVNKQCETVVLMTGDTDIVPAVKTTKLLFPERAIVFAFPFGRQNNELAKIVSHSFKIRVDSYIKNQFPDPVVLPDGKTISKPASW